MNHSEQNMQEMQLPASPFNKQKWMGLIELLAVVETVEYMNVLLAAHKLSDYECPATEEYAKAFPALVREVQEVINTVSEACLELNPLLMEALEQYNYNKLQAIANCPKEDCKDRDIARKELGWDGEKQVLL